MPLKDINVGTLIIDAFERCLRCHQGTEMAKFATEPNRAEASHRHIRRREKIMGRFKSPRQAQVFLSVHDQTAVLFRPKRHRLSAISYRHARAGAFDLWGEYTDQLIG